MPWQSPTRRRRPLRLVAPALLLAFLGLFLARSSWLPLLGNHLLAEDELAAADAILPLAGELVRVEQAAEYYRLGYGKRLLVTPLPLDSEDQLAAHLETVRTLARANGVPPGAIAVIDRAGRSTFEEALNVRNYAEENDIQSLLLVTSPWHTRRSGIIFRDVFAESGIEIIVQAVDDDWNASYLGTYRPEEWWTYRRGWQPTVSEYLKLAAYGFGVR